MGILVVQIIRHRVSALYLTTLGVRALFCVGFVVLYALSGDPLFLAFLAVVGIGLLATSVSYVLIGDRVGTEPVQPNQRKQPTSALAQSSVGRGTPVAIQRNVG